MHWLIVEDALRDRKGHWLESVTTFDRGVRRLGDEVTVLADAEAEKEVREALRAEAILPRSIWHRLGDGSGPLTRYSRVFIHNWQTWRVMDQYLRKHPGFDAIFVPTVSVHHLLAWVWLIKKTLRHRTTRLLLLFIHGPLKMNRATGKPVSDGSPTARLMFRLLRSLRPEIDAGKVVLAMETEAMREGLESATGVPCVFFPQPVAAVDGSIPAPVERDPHIRMACYGPARAEKGSDILQTAILLHRRRYPSSLSRFTIQWMEDFTVNGGVRVGKSAGLMADPQVEFLTRYIANSEYPLYLQKTDVMLLPYRLHSYGVRGSRVGIEAAIHGIPIIATRGSTLATLANQFGVCLDCEDGNPQSLADAIRVMELRYAELRAIAESRKAAAANYFSVATFREQFVNSRKAGKLLPAHGTRMQPV